jgi:NADPH:quinone reductase-like Zn-dependent oxidoreductase
MRAVRLHPPGSLEALRIEDVAIPRSGPGEVLVQVHAAAITRDELEWPADRLPAIPSYEVSGIVVEIAQGIDRVAVGDAVCALTRFDRDGAAAEYAVVPAGLLAPKPANLGHVESAALPMAGLSAWQGLFVAGDLQAGERALILGAAGGVGHVATQLARWRGAHVIGTASGAGVGSAISSGAHEVIDRTVTSSMEGLDPVDLVFDTVGGEQLARSVGSLRDGGRLISIAEEPAAELPRSIRSEYFVVEPDGAQLAELVRLAGEGSVRPAVDSVFPLADGRAAFERVMASGKSGKVVIEVIHDRSGAEG